jgi:hypothetical protein
MGTALAGGLKRNVIAKIRINARKKSFTDFTMFSFKPCADCGKNSLPYVGLLALVLVAL